MILTKPLSTLPGIGTKRRPLFERLLGTRVIDALFHLPCDIINRHFVTQISQAKEGETITVIAEVMQHFPSPPYRGKPYVVACSDGKNFFDLVFFRGHLNYLETALPVQSKRLITGKLERYQGRRTITHPDAIASPEEQADFSGPEPVYPLTTGITNRCVGRVMKAALSNLPSLPEWLDPPKAAQWPAWHAAIQQAHAPQNAKDLDAASPARLRLAYDELLAHQLSMALIRRRQHTKTQGLSIVGNGRLTTQIQHALPFELTAGQRKTLAEIHKDMASSHQMLRLLQGDVGSGKTIVALIAMAQAVEAGYQAAILAPTDILARQHAQKLSALCEQCGIRLNLLTAREKGKKRTEILEKLTNHAIDILVGTHAIIQEAVAFAKLGLVIVDEQHRFGVDQRLALMEKGQRPDVLAMTATPIPRTLMLAHYGDMDLSIIPDKPIGRLPIDTKVMPLTRSDEVIAGVKRALASGTKMYWVCPLVEESEALDLAAAVERHESLSQLFPGKVGLVHGKLKASEKDEVMQQFIEGPIDILIATTVIEVGVDVPAASIMIIEHAERFGLSQLHQLRGRIGRGNQTATCLLLYGKALSVNAKKRLTVMRSTNDGFVIAEEDLKLRGSGELLGTKQSGMPRFRIADFSTNPDLYGELLALAHKDARQICQDDPDLATPRGQALQLLLSLQNRDEAAKYSRTG